MSTLHANFGMENLDRSYELEVNPEIRTKLNILLP